MTGNLTEEPRICPQQRVRYKASPCPECLVLFVPSQPRQLFCCDRHKKDFHYRASVRGRQLAPLVMAARMTRGGTCGDTATGKRARADAEQLIARFAAEDRAAGRMSAVDYLALRDRKGVMQW
mgnify:CR=1 FL=1